MPSIDRRSFLAALGAGTSSVFLPSLFGDKAAVAAPPPRFFLYYTPHGPVQQNYTMRPTGPGGWNGTNKADRGMSYDFALPDSEAGWSQILKPLFPIRKKVLVLEGLAMTSALIDQSTNNHNAGTSHALTAAKMVIPGGFKQEGAGGASSIDQIIADKIADPNRVKSLYYTTGGWSPVYRGKTEQTGQSDLAVAYDKLFPISATGDATADYVKTRRANAMKLARKQYERLVPKLSGDDKAKIQNHLDLLADLERQYAFKSTAMCNSRPATNPWKNGMTHRETVAGFASVMAPALACDFTRVAVFANGGLGQADATRELDVHTDLHLDVAHNATPANPTQMLQMTKYYALLASGFFEVVNRLEQIPVEGGKTLLDYTLCLWMCELANGPHDMHDIMAVVAGGGALGNGLTLGRYVKYAEDQPNPRSGSLKLGPAHSKLLVSMANIMGDNRTTVGMTKSEAESVAKAQNRMGNTFDVEGPLPRLKA